MNSKIIIFIGKSGSGKSYLMNKILKDNPSYRKVVTSTSRPCREHESDGVDYNFLTREEFEFKIETNNFAEWTCFNNWYYGTPFDAFKENEVNVVVLNPAGARTILKNLENKFDICIFYLDCDDKTRLMRQLNREEEPNCSEIARRFLADEADFKNIDDLIYRIDSYIIKNTQDLVYNNCSFIQAVVRSGQS